MFACAIFWRPLMRAGRTLRQFPFVAEQVGEEVVAPLRGRRSPGDFQAAADGVTTVPFAELVLPSEALILDVGAFWFVANILSGNTSAVGLAKGMSAGNERDGLLVIHRNAGECFPNVACRSDGIGLSIGPFGIHVDQPHLDRAERTCEITITAVALVCKPRALGTPVHFFGLPHIGASAAKTERLKAHGIEGNVAGENHEVGPDKLPS